MPTIRDTFVATWRHEPYDYQVRVSDALLSGTERVVLVAPTGSGKTKAALHPFVHTRLVAEQWTDRLLYALPVRTLTASLYIEHAEQLRGIGLSPGMQTGIHKDDPYFRSEVCFATIDQLLSAYVGEPVSVSLRQGNIPAAGLVGAFTVFDEFHLLDTDKSMSTVVDLARRLKGFTPLLIMTATAPLSAVDFLAKKLDAEVIVPTPEDLGRMPSQSRRRRTYARIKEQLTASTIESEHRKRTIAVFNTVGRAQAAFEELRTLQPSAPPENLLLLHSRFLAADRQRIERRILELFNEHSTAEAILVATQVVEVGLNISCDRLLTEVAPANSLVQRAGRCARFAGETGEVQVFDVPRSKDGRPFFAPYPESRCTSTELAMQSVVQEPTAAVTFDWERRFVDLALGEAELKALKANDYFTHAHEIAHALTSVPQGAYRRFVRAVDGVFVIVNDAPERLALKSGVEALSVSTGTLRSALRRLDLKGQHKGVVVYPEWSSGTDSEEDEHAPLVRQWVPLQDECEVGRHWLLVLSSEVAEYDPHVGLRLITDAKAHVRTVDGESPQEASPPERGAQSGGAPKRGQKNETGPESFRKHALDVARYAVALARTEGPCGLTCLARAFQVKPEVLLRLIEFCGLLHDSGKLTRRWQSRAWEVESRLSGHNRPDDPSEARYLAHTSGTDHRRAGLPPHSMAGGIVTYDVLRRFAPDTWGLDHKALAAAAVAVARHHHPLTSTLDSFVLESGAPAELSTVLRTLPEVPTVSVQDSLSPRLLEQYPNALISLVNPASGAVWALYWLIVRYLRLADQASQVARLAARQPM